jgi:MYXO-CTERM domain-containing protein
MVDRKRKGWALLGGVVAVAGLAGYRLAEARTDRAPDAGAAAVTGFAKGPYLQALGATGVTIKVELPAPAPARVEIYPAGETKAVASVSGDGQRDFHAIRVDGLRPGTTYEYAVTAGAVTSSKGRFTTAPDADKPFRFLAYGDNRTDADAHGAVVRAMSSVPADFWINTGDMVAKGPEPGDWRSFFAVEGPLLRDHCVFAAVGNHELYLGDHAGEVAFLRYFGGVAEGPSDKLYGSFRWANARFFVLNAMDGWTGEERDWLRAELDRALTEPGLAHRIAVMHWGPFSAGPHGNNPKLAQGDVIRMMRDRKVDLVIAGHDHVYERGMGQGIKYVVTGGGGAPLYSKKHDTPETLAFEPAYHFVDVAVDGERVRVVAQRASGGVIEACNFVGMGPWECDGARADVNAPAAPAPAPPPAPAAAPAAQRAGMTSCGCAVPGAPAGGGLFAAAVAALLALARRRR